MCTLQGGGVNGKMVGKAAAVLPVAMALLAVWVYWALLLPPPPKVCGSPGGPPVHSPRIRLADGRHLAYREWGVPMAEAPHRVILVHGVNSAKHFSLSASPELVEALGLYFLSFDRAGYGESDPHPGRTVKSEAMDILELADQLGLGDRFYVIGVSMGGYPAWSCIKHIPHRLAGVALVVPVINYWWPSLPANLLAAAYAKLQASDRRAFWVAGRAPWLLHAYMTQKLVTPSAIVAGHPQTLSHQDKEILKKQAVNPSTPDEGIIAYQQGVHESLHRDLMVAFGDWGFGPTELANNTFPGNEASVHIWQGEDDKVVDPELQGYIAERIPWVRYHVCSDCGHLFFFMESWSNAILEALVNSQQKNPNPSSPRGTPEIDGRL